MVDLTRMSRMYQLSLLLVIAALPCHSGEITGTVKPSATSVRVMCLYLDSELHCACDSMREKNVDSSGRFRFQELRKGRYLIEVYPAGLRCLPKIVKNIVVGDRTTNIGTVKLKPSAWVTGKVSPPGRNLSVSPVQSALTSYKTKPDGRFEVDGLTPGKHRLSVYQDDYLQQFVEVQITGVREHKLAPITLVSMSSVTGTLTGTLRYTRSTATGADLRREHNKLLVTAIPTGTVDTTQPGRDGSPPGLSQKLDAASGLYRIASLKPGRYDLAASGPGCIIRGVGDLPKADPSSADEAEPLLDMTNALGAAFDAKNEKGLQERIMPDCLFSGQHISPTYVAPAGVAPFLKQWGAIGYGPGERRLLFMRAGSDRAVVFTRAPAVQYSDHRVGGLEIIESWRFVRDNGVWKLSSYRSEKEMTDMLSRLRVSYTDQEVMRPIEKLAKVSIIITDNPKVAGVTVRAGTLTSDHDFDLRAQ